MTYIYYSVMPFSVEGVLRALGSRLEETFRPRQPVLPEQQAEQLVKPAQEASPTAVPGLSRPGIEKQDYRLQLARYLWAGLPEELRDGSAQSRLRLVEVLVDHRLLAGFDERVQKFFSHQSVINKETIVEFTDTLPKKFFNSERKRQIKRAIDRRPSVATDEVTEEREGAISQRRITVTQENSLEETRGKPADWDIVFETGTQSIKVSDEGQLIGLIKGSGVQMEQEAGLKFVKMLQGATNAPDLYKRFSKRVQKGGKFEGYNIIGAGGKRGRILFKFEGKQGDGGKLHIHMAHYKVVYGDLHKGRKSPK